MHPPQFSGLYRISGYRQDGQRVHEPAQQRQLCSDYRLSHIVVSEGDDYKRFSDTTILETQSGDVLVLIDDENGMHHGEMSRVVSQAEQALEEVETDAERMVLAKQAEQRMQAITKNPQPKILQVETQANGEPLFFLMG